MQNIGVIGLGLMGLPIAINLNKKLDSKVFGFDVLDEKRKLFEVNGGISVKSIKEICTNCNIIFLSLPTNRIVEGAITSILDFANSGTIIIDLSSSAPNMIKKMYSLALSKEISLLDSPVSGGESRAKDSSLVIMCGGDKKTYDQVEHLLLMIGMKATYMGNTGSGSVAKLANNIMVGIHIAAVAEAYSFAKKAGLDPDVLFLAIKDGLAKSNIMDVKVPMLLSKDLSPTARMSVHQKDLNNAVALAKEMDVEIPISDMILHFMNEMEEDGQINLDHGALFKVYEKHMNIIIEKNED